MITINTGEIIANYCFYWLPYDIFSVLQSSARGRFGIFIKNFNILITIKIIQITFLFLSLDSSLLVGKRGRKYLSVIALSTQIIAK
jgi:hypothetical protein